MPDLRATLHLVINQRGFQAGVRAARREADRLAASVDRSGQAARRQATGNEAANAAMRRAARAARQQATAQTAAAGTARQQAAAQSAAATATQHHSRSVLALHGRILGYSAAATAVLYTSTRIARSLFNTADAYTNLNNRLRLVTASEGQLVAVRRELLGLSQRTRTELTANAELYSRIALAATETGHSQTELLRVTELLNAQVAIGGNTSAEAAAGLTQFAQGLAAGRLQGDELRSVLENLQGVSEGLLRGFAILREQGQIDFDVTRANIRDLAAEGVLSSKLLLDAILASAAETERKFQDVDKTVQGAATELGNALTLLIGRIDQLTGASRGLGAALSGVAGFITDILTRDVGEIREEIAALERNLARLGAGAGDRPHYERRIAALRAELAEVEQQSLDPAGAPAGTGSAGPPATRPTPAVAELDLTAVAARQAEQRERAARERFAAELTRIDRAAEAKRLDGVLQEVDTRTIARAARERQAALAFQEEIERLDAAHRQRLAEQAAAQADTALGEVERWTDGAGRALEEYGRLATDAARQAQDAVTRGLQTMEDALTEFVTTGKLNFGDLVDSILADLARLVVRQSITGPLAQALGGVLGGAFGGGAAAGGGVANSIAGAPIFHAGGQVGALTARRRTGLDPALFAGAPRYHRGGLAGNEVPAILERGEVVLSRAQVAALGQASAQPPPVEIHFENRGTPQRPVEQDARFDGRRWIIDVVLDDLNTRGPISQNLGRQFGLREATV